MMLWSAWLPDILPHVPECPVIIAEHEVKRVAQSLCEKTRAWLVTPAAMPVIAAQAEVTIVLGANQDLVRIEKAWYDGVPMEVKTITEMDDEYADDWTTHTGTPSIAVQNSPGIIRLFPVPTAAAVTGLKVRASIKPGDAATGIDSEYAVILRETIKVGAKGALMLYPNKPWTNMELGAAYTGAFGAMGNSLAVQAATGFGRGRISSKPVWM